MPTYDYVCSKCSFTFDKILRIDDRTAPTQEPCPNCSAEHSIEISISTPSLVSAHRVDGLTKPPGQFRERMQQIKKGMSKTKNTLKDY